MFLHVDSGVCLSVMGIAVWGTYPQCVHGLTWGERVIGAWHLSNWVVSFPQEWLAEKSQGGESWAITVLIIWRGSNILSSFLLKCGK